MEASTFEDFAKAMAPAWRIIALDQRGHGNSDHAATYARDDYIGDISAFIDYLGLSSVVLLGNSLGGVNAFQFAARFPNRVRALIVEDIEAEVTADLSFTLPWAGTFGTREELVDLIGPRFLPYLRDSIRRVADGWRLPFDPRHMIESQVSLNGSHWKDWLATDCPALLLRGASSRLTSESQMAKMASIRRNTRHVTIDGGHVIHVDNPQGFVNEVQVFLGDLPKSAQE
jgi:pimeloyl-ACP methyl ester carboxylesterase